MKTQSQGGHDSDSALNACSAFARSVDGRGECDEQPEGRLFVLKLSLQAWPHLSLCHGTFGEGGDGIFGLGRGL